MIKLIEYCVKFITLLILTVLMTSCKYNLDLNESITGSGKIITEERTLEPFSKIKVSNGIDCEITQSNNQKVVVEADDNVIKSIKTRVENGTLIIESEFNSYIDVTSKKVTIQVPIINSLETTSGATLITKKTIKGTSLKLSSSSGSDLSASLEYDNITTDSSSGSTQNLSGKALKLTTDSSSGSTIDADNLLSNEITATSASGSSTSIHPLETLKANASSGSSIDYQGTPKNITKDESSGGSID